jgi:hypothetical protein
MGDLLHQYFTSTPPKRSVSEYDAHLRFVHLRFTITHLDLSGNAIGQELWFTLECDLDDPVWHDSPVPGTTASPFHPQARIQPPQFDVWTPLSKQT